MNKEQFLSLYRSGDINQIIYIFLLENSPVQFSPEESQGVMNALSMYYGMSMRQGIQKMIHHYEKKFHIEIWTDQNNKVFMYDGQRTRN